MSDRQPLLNSSEEPNDIDDYSTYDILIPINPPFHLNPFNPELENDPTSNDLESNSSIPNDLDDLNTPMCRICLDDSHDPSDPDEEFFTPCRCSGTNKYVHRGCLNTWRATSNNPEAFRRCFSCNYKYKYRVHPEAEITKVSQCNQEIANSPGVICCIIFFIMIGFTYAARAFDKKHLILNFYTQFGTTILKKDPLNTDFFYYYVFVAHLVFCVICSTFFLNILRMKHRKLYLKYCFGGISCCRYLLIFTIVTFMLLTFFMSTLIAAICISFLIQFFIRTHYSFIRHLHRATSTSILEYDPSTDREVINPPSNQHPPSKPHPPSNPHPNPPNHQMHVPQSRYPASIINSISLDPMNRDQIS